MMISLDQIFIEVSIPERVLSRLKLGHYFNWARHRRVSIPERVLSRLKRDDGSNWFEYQYWFQSLKGF